jgi:hypothetical protein
MALEARPFNLTDACDTEATCKHHRAVEAIMGNAFSYLVALVVGVALGAAVVIARPRQPLKPSRAKVCGDLKLIRDGALADAKAADKRGDKAAADKSRADAAYTKDWANRGGCSWAS